MKKKKYLKLLCAILGLVFIPTGCGSNRNDIANTELSESEKEKNGEERYFDRSELKSDLAELSDDTITEIVLYWGNKEYSTKNKEVIEQIKEKLLSIELIKEKKEEETLEEIPLCDKYNLYLISNGKLYYLLKSEGIYFYCGTKTYSEYDGRGFEEAINIAKQTFWRD